VSTRIYPLGDRWGLLIDEVHERIFDTLGDATMATEKATYGENLRQIVTVLAGLDDVDAVWTARDYLTTLTNDDLEAVGMTKQQASDTITMIGLILPILTTYQTLVNALRTDV
jgi:hypothetical protein